MSYPVGYDETPPLHQPYDPDGITAFHAARLLLLIEVCGSSKRSAAIEGSTKLAKLDFFLRYPTFLARAHAELLRRGEIVLTPLRDPLSEVEAPMIRYRFGPWDPRYRQYVAFLEARGLIGVAKGAHGARKVTLKTSGRQLARTFLADPNFHDLRVRAESMVGNLAAWQGSELKDFIYELLADEVAGRSLGEEIRP